MYTLIILTYIYDILNNIANNDLTLQDRLSEPGNNYDLAIENPITDEEIMKS